MADYVRAAVGDQIIGGDQFVVVCKKDDGDFTLGCSLEPEDFLKALFLMYRGVLELVQKEPELVNMYDEKLRELI